MNDGDTGVLELEVIALRRESDCVLSVELADPEKRALPGWKPGAHIDLGLPEHIRQYSLVGDPSDRHSYRIAVLREPESSGGSSYVHAQLRPGELVEIGGPRNNFPLAGADRYLMIAGGVGITPLLPMIRELHAQNKDWRLLYGGRSRRSMAYLAELAEYGRRVDVRPFDECGHLDLDSELATPSDNTVVYCCGPEALISAVENHCETWPAGALHVERFSLAHETTKTTCAPSNWCSPVPVNDSPYRPNRRPSTSWAPPASTCPTRVETGCAVVARPAYSRVCHYIATHWQTPTAPTSSIRVCRDLGAQNSFSTCNAIPTALSPAHSPLR